MTFRRYRSLRVSFRRQALLFAATYLAELGNLGPRPPEHGRG